jgi:hypothetical protein
MSFNGVCTAICGLASPSVGHTQMSNPVADAVIEQPDVRGTELWVYPGDSDGTLLRGKLDVQILRQCADRSQPVAGAIGGVTES